MSLISGWVSRPSRDYTKGFYRSCRRWVWRGRALGAYCGLGMWISPNVTKKASGLGLGSRFFFGGLLSDSGPVSPRNLSSPETPQSPQTLKSFKAPKLQGLGSLGLRI